MVRFACETYKNVKLHDDRKENEKIAKGCVIFFLCRQILFEWMTVIMFLNLQKIIQL